MAGMVGVRQVGPVFQVGLPEGVSPLPAKAPAGYLSLLRLDLPAAQATLSEVAFQSRTSDTIPFALKELLYPLGAAAGQLPAHLGGQF